MRFEINKQRRANLGGKMSPRQRELEGWRKTDGGKERTREMEGGQMELRSQTFDSSWEEYLWGTLFLIGVCVCVCLGYVCVLTAMSCYMVNHSTANTNSLFVYITLWVCSTQTLYFELIYCVCVCVFVVLVHHYTHGLPVMCLETPVCNGWKPALPAGPASNC